MTKLIVNNRTDALKTDINLFFMMTNCQIALSRALTHRQSEHARISAVIIKNSIAIYIAISYHYDSYYFLGVKKFQATSTKQDLGT